MGEIHEPTPVLFLIAVSSRYDDVLTWAAERVAEEFGPLQLKSERFDFTETDYYQATMGQGPEKAVLGAPELDRSGNFLRSNARQTNGRFSVPLN